MSYLQLLYSLTCILLGCRFIYLSTPNGTLFILQLEYIIQYKTTYEYFSMMVILLSFDSPENAEMNALCVE